VERTFNFVEHSLLVLGERHGNSSGTGPTGRGSGLSVMTSIEATSTRIRGRAGGFHLLGQHGTETTPCPAPGGAGAVSSQDGVRGPEGPSPGGRRVARRRAPCPNRAVTRSSAPSTSAHPGRSGSASKDS